MQNPIHKRLENLESWQHLTFKLISLFPNELKGAKDVTEHQRGEHSYY